MPRRNSLLFFAGLVIISMQLLGCGCNGSRRIVISGSFPATGTVGTAYSGTVTATGGSGTLTWGSPTGLPPGIVTETVPTPGQLTVGGTPTTAGSYSVSATVMDAKGHSATYSVTIVISAPAALTVTTTSLLDGTVGTVYTTQMLTATGGTTPYTWAVTSGGALPGGLMLTGSTGAISGTPTTAGTFGPYVFTVTDANNNTAASMGLTITIVAQSSIHLTIPNFPVGTVGVPYTGATLSATGGTAPYTWVMTQNTSYIPGLTMDSSTGLLTGTPTKAVSGISIGVKVTDSSMPTPQVAVGNFLITINATTATACAAPASGALPTRGNEGALTSATPYAFLVQGNNSTDEGDFGVAISGIAIVGSFTPNGDGTITAGAADYNGENLDLGQPLVVDLAASSYSFGADGRGCLFLAFSGLASDARPAAQKANSARFKPSALHKARLLKAHPEQSTTPLANLTLSFALAGLDGSGVYHLGRIMEFDNTSSGGSISAGLIHLQDPTSFALTALQPNYAFGIEGWGEFNESSDYRIAVAGTFAVNTANGSLSNGYADVNAGGSSLGEMTGGSGGLNGNFSTSGRTTGMYSIPDGANGPLSYSFALYMINANDFFLITTDSVSEVPLLSGRALTTNSGFAATPLDGYYLAAASGFDVDLNGNYVEVGTLNVTSSGTVPAATLNVNDVGEPSTNPYSGMTYTVDAAGRFTASSDSLTYPLIGYLTAGGDASETIGAFLVADVEPAQAASAGVLVSLNTSSPPNYTIANITGTYALGSEDVDGFNGGLVGTFSIASDSSYSYLLDVAEVGAANQANQTGSGTVSINADGSGTVVIPGGNNLTFVTNGAQIYAIDFTDVDPLLYIFDQGIASE